jgi:hypothetical protein
MKKIGKVRGKPFPYPNTYSAVINRCIARYDYSREPEEFFAYAKRVEARFKRMYHR